MNITECVDNKVTMGLFTNFHLSLDLVHITMIFLKDDLVLLFFKEWKEVSRANVIPSAIVWTLDFYQFPIFCQAIRRCRKKRVLNVYIKTTLCDLD